MNDKIKTQDRLIITYHHLRKVIGIIAISLPFILLLGDPLIFNHYEIQPSISHYYYTGMGDVFVGILFAFGVFLFSYRGYERKDDIAGDLACLFALGVALFPTTPDIIINASDEYIGYVHAVSTGLFFLTLSYFSLFLFTKTGGKKPSAQKKKRIRVYQICGGIMLGCMLAIIAYYLLPQSTQDMLSKYKPILFFEASMIIAFGISWFTKGQGLYADAAAENTEAST